MIIRPERPDDAASIRRINIEAFADHPYSQQTEHLIVEELRDAGALELSLVAELDGAVVGHAAFSHARIGDAESGWYLLGPLAVLPEQQGRGVGRALVEAGLAEVSSRGALGCVLVGDPAFYQRFGFVAVPGVTCAGVPDANVLCLRMTGPVPNGELSYPPAFSVSAEGEVPRMTRVDDAGRLFMEGKSCSQAVFTAFAPSLGVAEADALRLASGLGGGMHAGSACGAATGAVLALGLAYAGDDCASDRATVMAAVEAFHARFRERVGATDCPDILGCDVRTAEGIAFNRAHNLRETRCLGVVRTAAEILEELLDAEWRPER